MSSVTVAGINVGNVNEGSGIPFGTGTASLDNVWEVISNAYPTADRSRTTFGFSYALSGTANTADFNANDLTFSQFLVYTDGFVQYTGVGTIDDTTIEGNEAFSFQPVLNQNLFALDIRGSSGVIARLNPAEINTLFASAGGITFNIGALTGTIIDNDFPNQPPTAVNFINTTPALNENSDTTSRIKVADITITDDGQGTNGLSLSGSDAGVFELVGTTLYLKAGTTLDFETKTSYSVTVNVDDAAVGTTPDASNTFTLSVNNVNENLPPIAQNDLITTDANTPIDFNIFADNGNGPDSDPNRDTFRVSDTDYPNNFRGNVEVFFDTGTASYDPAGVFDYLAAGETATTQFTYTITDGTAISNVATATITVTGVNDNPTDLTLSNTTIAENSDLGTVIGSFSTVDPDTSNTTFTYSLVDAANFSDNSAFTITNNQLKVNAAFNFESDSSYSIKVRTTDQDGGFYDEVLTIGVTNVNEAPTVTGETVSTSQNTGNPVTSVTVELGDNLSDPDANGLANAILNVTGITNGTVASIDQDARLVSFTPTASFSGTASFNYTLTDAGGLTSNTATVTIDVGSVISTGNRNQEIEGNNGDDIISAGNGSDRILGLGGDDRVFGNNGNDFLDGGDGNDSLFGGNGTDTLLGGNGNDLLDGGNGPDIVTGGAGSDRFVLTASAGGDTFTDFTDNFDQIVLSGGLTIGQLTIVASGGNTTILLGSTTLATLTNVSSNLITTDADFVTV